MLSVIPTEKLRDCHAFAVRSSEQSRFAKNPLCAIDDDELQNTRCVAAISCNRFASRKTGDAEAAGALIDVGLLAIAGMTVKIVAVAVLRRLVMR